ncbi:hypothetical protein VTH06DRAFT_181, partial [Thermothelomyces fergusii]
NTEVAESDYADDDDGGDKEHVEMADAPAPASSTPAAAPTTATSDSDSDSDSDWDTDTDTDADKDKNKNKDQQGVAVEAVRRYADARPQRRLNFPPARWNGDMCAWWPGWGAVPGADDFGVPDEPGGAVPLVGRHNGVHFRSVPEGVPVVLYAEMVLDHCETGPWDVEWLRVIRNRH